MASDMQQYLERHNVPEIITAMVESLCVEKPTDAIRHMQRVLQGYANKASSSGSSNTFNTFMGSSDSSMGMESESDHEGEHPCAPIDDHKSEQIRRRYSTTNRRLGVSSEVTAETADDVLAAGQGPMAPPGRTPNPPEVRARIEKSLLSNILFAQLEKTALDTISESMFECNVAAGEKIIKQNDPADNFYVIESGICNVYVVNPPEPEPCLVSTLGPQSSFGELALMYGTPRAATVEAATDVRLWALDRETYRRILLQQMDEKRRKYETFLKKVPILDALNEYERMTIADALQQSHYKDGHVIIQEGQPGNSFYIIVEGNVKVTQTRDGTTTELTRLNEGDFFGEVALMLNQPRVATVTATGDVTCVHLDRKSFQRLLGPIEEILKRNMQTYSLYVTQRI